MLYFTCELADILYSENQNAVKISWKQNTEDSNKYFLIQSKAFALLKEKGCENWMSDLRQKRELSFYETEWLRRFMLPQAIENKVKKVAFVINAEDRDSIRQDAITNVVRNKLNLKFFTDEKEAENWFSRVPVI